VTGGLRGLLRRLLPPRRLVLQPIQADFVRIASARFDFLVRDWGYVAEVTGDEMFDLNVLFRGPRVAVEITFSEQTWILTKALPLSGGRLPEWFDAKLNDLYTGFALEDFFGVVDPSWHRPPHERIESAAQIERELHPYAEALARDGDRLLAGDAALLDDMRDRTRRETIAVYTRNWADFVARVRRGFDGPITEYTTGIIARSQLEAFLTVWQGSRADDPTGEIAGLDEIFEKSTEPLVWGAGTNAILPTPNARRWWRRPKWLTGSLRDYFEIHSH
jgi:hypothetical protein